jgi:hypothetical protein
VIRSFAVVSLLSFLIFNGSSALAEEYASAGKVTAKLYLNRIDKDGFTRHIAGNWLIGLFADHVAFEITPSSNNYMIPGRGSSAHKKLDVPNLNFEYHMSDWGYSESWKMSATLSAENVKTLLGIVCNDSCMSNHSEVVTAINSMDRSEYAISANYSAYHGDTVGWSDTDGLKTSITFPLPEGEQLELVLKFPRHWRLYDVDRF